MEQTTISGHVLDLTRLRRRKSDLNVTCLRWNWRDHSPWAGMPADSSWCIDTTNRFPLSHYGVLSITCCGEAWNIRFGYNTDWSGTTYEGWESSSDCHNMFGVTFVGTLMEAKRHAELIYSSRVVPYLLKYGDAQEAMKLDLWISENGWTE